MVLRGWRDLDRFSLQLWTLRSIILKIVREEERGGLDLEDLVPELTGRGTIDLVEPNCMPSPSLPHQPIVKSPTSDYDLVKELKLFISLMITHWRIIMYPVWSRQIIYTI